MHHDNIPTDLYRLLFDNSMDAVFLAAPDGAILAANPTACSMFGMTEGEICTGGLSALLQLTEPHLASSPDLHEKAGKERGELRYLRNDGTTLSCDVSLIAAEDRNTAFVIVRDVTSQKKMEEELRLAQEQLAAELAEWKLLQRVSSMLIHQGEVAEIYEEIINAAAAIMHSDFASIQMLYPEQGEWGQLRLLAYRGFTDEAASFWEWVTPVSESTCGIALRSRQRVVASDVETCEFMQGSEDQATYLRTGIRAVQTTPLLSRNGELVGMISTHWRQPHEPTEHELGLLDILARLAADMIERRRAEEALRFSEQRFSQIFDAAPLAIILGTIPDGRIVNMNEASLKLFGISKDEYFGKTSIDLGVCAEPDVRASLLAEAEKTGFVRNFEMKYRTKTGEEILVSINMDILDFGGQRHALFCAENITDRKKTELALRRSEELHRTVFENISDGILIADPSGKSVFFNPAFARLHELDKTRNLEAAQQRFEISDMEGNRLLPDEWPQVKAARGERLTEVEVAVFDRKSRKRWIGCYSAIPVLNDDGTVRHVVMTVRDITTTKAAFRQIESEVKRRTEELANTLTVLREEIDQRQLTERVLRENEALLKTVLETIPVAVFVADRDGRLTFRNETAKHLWGGELEVGINDYDRYKAWCPDTGKRMETHECGMARAIRDGELTQGEILQIETFDGKLKTIIHSATPIRSQTGEIIGGIAVSEDITHQAELQKQLLHAQKLDSVGQLAGGVAHDFNNILTAMCGFTEIVYDDLQDESLRGHLQQVLKAGETARDLANKLLVFSRQQVTEMKVINLADNVAHMLQFVSRLIGEHIEIDRQVSAAPLPVRANSSHVDQIFMNIILNARDAMPTGGTLSVATGTVEFSEDTAAEHGLKSAGNYGFVRISDTGVGISKKNIDRIFEPYFTTKETEKGTGLGLAIAYGIVRQHNGAIAVDSVEGEGTTFTIYLPLTEKGEPAAATQVAASLPKGAERILVVEDDAAVLAFLQMALRRAGYCVIASASAKEALQVFESTPVDVLVTDVIMPGMNGMDMYREMGKLRSDIKVIFLSGYSSDIVGSNGIQTEEFRFLQKPVSRDTLLRMVREVLDC